MTSRYYYWLTGIDDGRRFLILASDKSSDEAVRKGLEMLGSVDFQVKKFATRDMATASRLLKGNILEKSKDIRVATKKLKHKNVNRGN